MVEKSIKNWYNSVGKLQYNYQNETLEVTIKNSLAINQKLSCVASMKSINNGFIKT